MFRVEIMETIHYYKANLQTMQNVRFNPNPHYVPFFIYSEISANVDDARRAHHKLTAFLNLNKERMGFSQVAIIYKCILFSPFTSNVL